jgi:hypothetical protein
MLRKRLEGSNERAVLNEEEKLKLNELEGKVNRLLANRDVKWRLKS